MSCAVTLARRNLRALPKLQFHCLCGSGRKARQVCGAQLALQPAREWRAAGKPAGSGKMSSISLGKRCDVLSVDVSVSRTWAELCRNLVVTWL